VSSGVDYICTEVIALSGQHRPGITRRLVFVLALSLLLAAAGGGGCSCRRGSDSTAGTDPADVVQPESGQDSICLAGEWSELLAQTTLGTDSKLLTDWVRFSLDDSGRFDAVSATLYDVAAGVGDAVVYRLSLREEDTRPTIYGGDRRVAVDPAHLVDPLDLWTCLDAVSGPPSETATTVPSEAEEQDHAAPDGDPRGAVALAPPGSLERTFWVNVVTDAGQVLPSAYSPRWFLVEGGRAAPLGTGSAVSIEGRRVVIESRDSDALLENGMPDHRNYLLAELSDPVQKLGMLRLSQDESMAQLDLKRADFDGDGVPEFVYLLGLREPDSTKPVGLGVLITWSPDGFGEPLPLQTPPSVDGFDSNLDCRALDLTGDDVPELLVTWTGSRHETGYILGVYGIAAHPPSVEPLFATWEHVDPGGVTGLYLGDGRARVAVDSAGLAWELDLSDRPEDYDRQACEGFAAAGAGPFRRPFDVADRDGDGLPEIAGRQFICGIDESDVVACLSQVFAWDPDTGRFVRRRIELFPTGDPVEAPLRPLETTVP